MKILISTHRSYPVLGGLERHVYKYCKHISEQEHIDILNLAFAKENIINKISENFVIKNIKSKFIFGGAYPVPFLGIFKYFKEIKIINPDVIHTHGRYFITTYIAYLYALIYKKPLIHTEHIEGDMYFKNRIESYLINGVFSFLSRFLFNKADKITAVSESATSFLSAKFKIKVDTVYNFIDLQEIDKELEQEVDTSCFKQDLKKIVFPYRFVKSKGYELLDEFIRLNPDYQYIIIGGGEGENYIRNLQNKYENIKYLGELNHKETIAYLNNCDALLNLSSQEGLSTTILEAMYLKKNIIAFNLPSNIELLSNYPKAYLIDKIRNIEIKDVSSNTNGFKYTLEKSAKMYFDIYKKYE